MEKLLESNIKTAHNLLVKKAITAEQLLEACKNRINKLKHLNAFIKTIDGKPSNALDKNQVLGNIPVAVKDNFCLANEPTTCASKMLENFVPTYTATPVERLQKSGAVILGKTNLDQFAMGSGTVDSIFGPTKNPYNYSEEDFHISGGSSGGSAVAVATGQCFAALGSDTGGSTRNPASYCGLVGLKPTYGLVSRHGLIPLVNSMDVPGILSRFVDDAVFILNSCAGHDEKDSTSIRKPYRSIQLPKADKLSVKDLKIGVPVEYNCEFLHPEVLETWNKISLLLQSSGATVKQVSLPHTELSIVCYSILNQCEVASNMARFDGLRYGYRSTKTDNAKGLEELYAATRKEAFNEVVRNRILAGNYFLIGKNYEKYFEKALKVRRLISDDFYRVWDEVQVLLTPTTLTTAPKFADFTKKSNRDQCALQDFCTQPANMAGVPAVSIPIELSKEGLPISLQIMGRNLSEPMILALAKFIEQAVKFRSV